MLEAGKETGSGLRIKNNMINTDSPFAPLYTLRKDHKMYDDSVKGPPMRPVCGSHSSLNHKLSYLLSTLLGQVWKSEDAHSICMNTEEMLAEIEAVNCNQPHTGLIIGSTDVKALYPSLDIPFAIEKVCEVFYDSDIKIDGVNYEEVGLYLSLNRTYDELKELALESMCPKRKTMRGRPPTITGSGVEDRKEKRFASWKNPDKMPDDTSKRKMLKEALKIALKVVMESHVYIFDNDIQLQRKGGPIGLDLTGTLAQIFMLLWDRELRTKFKDLEIECSMYKRYVDDINMVISATPPGMRYKDKKLYLRRNAICEDQAISADKRTMLLIQDIGNDIHPSIQLEVDFPSNHEDGKMPILDLKVWIEKHETHAMIMHEFYSKEVSSKNVINAKSAIPWSTKRTVLTQEILH